MTKIIRFKDLVVGQYYKLPSDEIFKVEYLTWHVDGAHEGKIKDLILVRKDGTKKSLTFLFGDTETRFIAIVAGYKLNELEIENQRLRRALEFYAEETHYRPVTLACGDKEIFIERDCGKIAREALAGEK